MGVQLFDTTMLQLNTKTTRFVNVATLAFGNGEEEKEWHRAHTIETKSNCSKKILLPSNEILSLAEKRSIFSSF